MWGLIPDRTYPFLLGPEGYITINDVNDLQAMNLNPNGHYILGGDIDASITASWNGGHGLIPIGANHNPFTGTFEGKGHTISGVFVRNGISYFSWFVGLFESAISPAYVSDVRLENFELYGTTVGALAGYANGATFRNINISGKVWGGRSGGAIGHASDTNLYSVHANCEVIGQDRVGGLIGWYRSFGLPPNPQLLDSSSSGSVVGRNFVGGLIGSADARGVIEGCSSSASVSGADFVGGFIGKQSLTVIRDSFCNGDVFSVNQVGGFAGYHLLATHTWCSGSMSNVVGEYQVGGFVGYAEGNPFANTGTINQSFSTGSVVGMNEVGGFAGTSTKGFEIVDSYRTGPVGGITRVGGFAGSITVESVLNRTYSAGKVTGSTGAGGLVGSNDGGSVVASFWDVSLTGRIVSGGGTGLPTSKMVRPGTFESAGWDLDTIWDIQARESYPFLRCSPVLHVPLASRNKR
ncbi:MAG: hypothetical protein IID08_06820 [Candidatus Hydrogenedentes bacterium]|nr:hypothetical protein [Candidatus Hydrogenedentota bacterium]